jgi:hypothetical protein
VSRMTIELVRDAVSIEAVLTAHDVALPKKGSRIGCPVHKGRNPSAFTFGPSRFSCFNCGARGDVIDLERALGGGSVADALATPCVWCCSTAPTSISSLTSAAGRCAADRPSKSRH